MTTVPTQYIVDEHGEKTAAILAIDVYQELLEDLHDLRIVAERREESTVALQEMMQRLQIADADV
jgi:hypothetical protein